MVIAIIHSVFGWKLFPETLACSTTSDRYDIYSTVLQILLNSAMAINGDQQQQRRIYSGQSSPLSPHLNNLL